MLVKAKLSLQSFPSNFYFSPQLRVLFNCLLQDGNELRVVGGAVRDFLANKKISDIDLACKYPPEKTALILKNHKIKTIATGIKYGTITAIVGEEKFQITTLRKDIENFGRDCKVEFVDNFYEDAKRRDFTINAMSVDFTGQIYDYFEGKQDLDNQIVKFIGDPNLRIKEDYLRILRFFRFSCFYGKIIEQDGLDACIKNKDEIVNLSIERIRDEFFKILSCQNQDNLLMVISKMVEVGILKSIFQYTEDLNGFKNILKLEKYLDYKFSSLILLAALNCHSQINLSKLERKYLQTIFSLSKIIDFKFSEKELFELLLDYDSNMINDALAIKLTTINELEIFIDDFLRIRKIAANASIPDFPINGYDLIAIGIAPENIGIVLKSARKYWLDSNFVVGKSQIIDFIKIA
jgi:poly(A) polymerase